MPAYLLSTQYYGIVVLIKKFEVIAVDTTRLVVSVDITQRVVSTATSASSARERRQIRGRPTGLIVVARPHVLQGRYAGKVTSQAEATTSS